MGEVSSEALWDALRRLIGEILTLPNRSLTVECLAVVLPLKIVEDVLRLANPVAVKMRFQAAPTGRSTLGASG